MYASLVVFFVFVSLCVLAAFFEGALGPMDVLKGAKINTLISGLILTDSHTKDVGTRGGFTG